VVDLIEQARCAPVGRGTHKILKHSMLSRGRNGYFGAGKRRSGLPNFVVAENQFCPPD